MDFFCILIGNISVKSPRFLILFLLPLLIYNMQQENIYRNLIERVKTKTNDPSKQTNIRITSLFSYVNTVYKVEVGEDDHEQISGKIFLIKMFRQAQFSNKSIENQVVSILSNHNLAPCVYYCSPEYRVEEFIDCYTPDNGTATEKQMVEYMLRLADLVKIFKNYSETKSNQYQNQRCLSKVFPIFEQINKSCQSLFPESYQIFQVYTEALLEPSVRQNLEKMVPKVVVPSHNDCHFCNTIVRHEDKKLFLIDFQFFCPNYRGFDVGTFFNEYTSDYFNFIFAQELQLPQATKDLLVSTYYKQIEPSLSLQEAKRQVEVGRMLSHLFWLFHGIKQIGDPRVFFDLQHYIRRRYEEFMKYYNKRLKNEKI